LVVFVDEEGGDFDFDDGIDRPRLDVVDFLFVTAEALAALGANFCLAEERVDRVIVRG